MSKQTGLTDTSPEAQAVVDEVYRRMAPARKWKLLGDAQRLARVLHLAGLRRLDPGATPADLQRAWVAHRLGDLARPVPERRDAVDQPIEDLQVVRDVAAAFRALGIGYALGGSLATSIHGAIRQTRDADLSAEPFPDRVDAFAARFGADYDVSPPAIREAIRDRSTFNLIHFPTGFKVDVFIVRDRPFDREVMRRRRPYALLEPPEDPIDIISAEDMILLKLEWYRLGDGVSDRQWSDILSVLRSRSDSLDRAYMERWAEELQVGDLLERALSESAVEGSGT